MKFGSNVLVLLGTLVMLAGSNVLAQENAKVYGLRGGSDAQDLDLTAKDEDHERLLTTALKGLDLGAEKGLEKKKTKATRRVIVRYKSGHKADTFNVMMKANKHRAVGEPEIQVADEFDELNTFVITATEDEIAVMVNSPDVEAIEDDPIRYPMSVKGSNANLSEFFDSHTRKLQETIPEGVNLVQAPEIWAQGVTGAGVKVCIIDTGIDRNNPDFVTTNLSGPSNSNNWFEDGCGHGTHVSGTVAAADDNKGVVGVAPAAEIFTVRVFGESCGIIFGSSLIRAARTCRDNGAKIISMSLGGPVRNFFEEIGFNGLVNNDDILIVAAAGNDGDTSKSYPASYSGVLSVAAVDKNKDHAAFSQRNDQVDIAAPGVDVLSTFPVGGCAICEDNTEGYGAISGTSMATPHVSGVAALLKSAFPDASMTDIRNAIESTALDLGSTGRDDLYGNGFIQANEALRLLNGENGDNTDGGGTDEGEEAPISECSDVPGWFDSDGQQYNCAWYAQDNNCAQYGSGFANGNGLTANDACCACGGGTSSNPPLAGVCSDFPEGWNDRFGSFYNCSWYAEGNNCERFGDEIGNDDKTANEACCACGGGNTV